MVMNDTVVIKPGKDIHMTIDEIMVLWKRKVDEEEELDRVMGPISNSTKGKECGDEGKPNTNIIGPLDRTGNKEAGSACRQAWYNKARLA